MGSEKVPFFINLKFAKSANMTEIFSIKISLGYQKNADLYSDSKFVEMG